MIRIEVSESAYKKIIKMKKDLMIRKYKDRRMKKKVTNANALDVLIS